MRITATQMVRPRFPLVVSDKYIVPFKTLTEIYPGDPGSHQEAKEIAAAFSGAFIDREVETRGLDFIDREKAKRMAQDQNNQAIDQSGQFGN